MSKSESKSRLISIYKILMRETDPEHYITIQQIIKLLEDEGISVYRSFTHFCIVPTICVQFALSLYNKIIGFSIVKSQSFHRIANNDTSDNQSYINIRCEQDKDFQIASKSGNLLEVGKIGNGYREQAKKAIYDAYFSLPVDFVFYRFLAFVKKWISE